MGEQTACTCYRWGSRLPAHATGGGADCPHMLQVGEQTACTCYRWESRLPAHATGGGTDCPHMLQVGEQTACTKCHKLCVLGRYFSDSMNIIALNDDKQYVCVCVCARACV